MLKETEPAKEKKIGTAFPFECKTGCFLNNFFNFFILKFQTEIFI